MPNLVAPANEQIIQNGVTFDVEHKLSQSVERDAAQRRSILANAHAAWHATRMNPAIDAVHNLKQALVQADYMATHDTIANVRLDGTTLCVRIDANEFFENVEIDAYGNILRGAD